MSATAVQNNNDRLVSALFAMALLHGLIILGVSFEFLPRADFLGSPSLEVILVKDPNQSDIIPDDAHYLSEENQSGSGTTNDKVRAESQFSTHNPISNAGSEDGNAILQKEAAKLTDVHLIVTRTLSDRSRASLEEKQADADDPTKAKLMREDLSSPDLISEYDDNTQIHSPELRELFVSVNTKKSDLARYLALWKRKIEQVGTLNFPEQSLLDGLSGNPTLEVVISANGYLEDVVLKRSSGEPRIDMAAMNIVRLASPFEAFPADLRAKYDVMRFVYVWQFVDGQQKDSSVKLPTPN